VLGGALESGSTEPVAKAAHNTVKQGLAGAYLRSQGETPPRTDK